MKGDLILLTVTAAAILVIPMSVTATAGGRVALLTTGETVTMASSSLPAPQRTNSDALPPPQRTSSDASYVTTPIDGGLPAMASSLPAPQRPNSGVTPPPQRPSSDATSLYKLLVKTLKVLDRGSGKVQEITIRDYVRGAIAAEMPASFHLEAMKAQGVAALSYALYHYEQQRASPDPLLCGAYFSADPDKREGYMTERAARKFYGDNANYNWGKVCDAADEAVQWVATSEGNPIAAAYHAISAGSTEDAANIWGGALPCISSVDSSWDVLASGYQSTLTLTQAQIKEKLADSGATLLPNPDTWFTVEQVSPAGYVTGVRVGNATMSGNQLRNLLGLRSSSFRIERQGKDFIFYVVGYGHGAGLSQNGADYMARQGKTFDQILTHYYRGVTLARVDN